METIETSIENVLFRTEFESPESSLSRDNQLSILSVAWYKGKLGAAYFDTSSQELQAFPEIDESSEKCFVLNSLFQQLRPHVVIVKENLEEYHMNYVCSLLGINKKATTNTSNTNTSLTEDECSLIVVPSHYFDAKKAIKRLLSLHLVTQPDDHSIDERFLFLKSSFPISCQATIQASGALLLLLEAKSLGSDIGRLIHKLSDATSFFVTTLRISYIKDLLYIDNVSLNALRVFSYESHPSLNVKGQSSSGKEGLSLFGLACKCYSSVGISQLRSIFLRPTQNVQILTQRYRTIEFLRRGHNQAIVEKLAMCLKKIVNLKAVLSNISLMQGSIGDWKKLLVSTTNLITLSNICGNLPQDIAVFKKMKEISCTGELLEIVDVIQRLIDFPESNRLGRFVINGGVDEKLDKLKATNEIRIRLFEEIANWEIARLPSFVNKAVIEFLPSTGHCLCVQSWLGCDEEMRAEVLSIPGLEMKFFTKENVYYKSNWCYALDERFGDLGADIFKHEMSLMLAAAKNVSKFGQLIINGIELAGYLDALLSLTLFSQEFNLVKPEPITSEVSFMRIVNGRHLLLELVVDTLVNNSATLGDLDSSSNRIFIVTGPNSSGKSFYLKQTATILYLAQIGSFVPADRFTFTPVDQIHLVCSWPETGSSMVSHCGFVLSRVARVVKEASKRSLVILDDITEATLPADAEALVFAIIEQWILKQFRPLVMMAAHLHLDTLNQFRNSFGDEIKFLSMAHSLDDRELVYYYLPVEEDEIASDSFPLSVAQAVGIKGRTVLRAQKVLALMKGNKISSLYNSRESEGRFLALRKFAEDILAVSCSDNFRENVKRAIRACTEAYPSPPAEQSVVNESRL